MEPIRTTKTARLGLLKMYREDLDQFLALFSKTCVNVTISDSHNRYISFDEMKDHIGSKIDNLDIRPEKPAVHFLLNHKENILGSSTPAVFNELRTEEITDEADTLFLRVKEFLVDHERRRVRTPALVVALVALLGIIWFSATNLVPNGQGGTAIHPTPGFGICFVLLLVSLVIGLNVGNSLSLETRINSPSFWARHREAFAAHAVTATVSTLLGGIVGWFACHFLK